MHKETTQVPLPHTSARTHTHTCANTHANTHLAPLLLSACKCVIPAQRVPRFFHGQTVQLVFVKFVLCGKGWPHATCDVRKKLRTVFFIDCEV